MPTQRYKSSINWSQFLAGKWEIVIKLVEKRDWWC